MSNFRPKGFIKKPQKEKTDPIFNRDAWNLWMNLENKLFLDVPVKQDSGYTVIDLGGEGSLNIPPGFVFTFYEGKKSKRKFYKKKANQLNLQEISIILDYINKNDEKRR